MFRNLTSFEIKVVTVEVKDTIVKLELPPLLTIVIGSNDTWQLSSSGDFESQAIVIGPGYKYFMDLGKLNTYPDLYIKTSANDQKITGIGGPSN